MQRILHITGTMDRAGAETMIMNLYREIDKTQIQFDFVFFGNRVGDYEEEINIMGGKIYRIAKKNTISRVFALIKLLKKHPEYKIVHSHTLLSSGLNLWAAYLAKVPMRIAHAHSTNDVSHLSFLGRLYKKVSLLMISKYANYYNACGIEASTFLFPTKKNVLILPNSIDTKRFAEIGDNYKEYINNEFNLNDEVLKIVQIGRLQKVKNHKFSIKIAKALKDKGVLFKMFFIGQGELYEEIYQEIIRLNLSNEVMLLGLRTDIPEIMAGADVMIMPSLHEGFPVVLVESQSVGLPAVVSDSVSPEVDLDVDLVDFESLESSIETWVEKLLAIKNTTVKNKQVRIEALSVQGFDISQSVKILVNLYNGV
ncbi:glycosyltransferase [Aequorivita sinensis]|uniref:glycosyltransferase n=1 Tax=Aequorivita sinensis TaxID=1382458 RepID=UPI00111E25A4|nr:glycosyltransferase [Aequorivita sinensis]